MSSSDKRSAWTIVLLVLLIVSAATLTTGWAFSDPAYIRVGWIICAFVTGAFVLGKWWLGKRTFGTEAGTPAGRKEDWRNIGLRSAAAITSVATVLAFHSWAIMISTILGTLFGLIVWPPPASNDTAQSKPVDQNEDPYPSWSLTSPDEAALAADLRQDEEAL